MFAFLICIAFKKIQSEIDYSILKSQKQNSQIFLMIDDLFAISKRVNHNLLPSEINLNLDDIRDCNMQFPVGAPFCNGIHNSKWWDNNKIIYEKVKNNWFKAIVNHPVEYLSYRIKTFIWFLGFPRLKPFIPYYFSVDINSFGILKKENFITKIVEQLTKTLVSIFPFFFTPITWLIINLLVVVKTYNLPSKSKPIKLAFYLSISSAVYIMTYILIVPGPDYRYIFWSVTSSHLSVFLLLSEFDYTQHPEE